MKKDINQLNRDLNFEFLRLDIKGANIESFYNYRFNLFMFENSELTQKEKIEVILTGQLDGKTEITINKALSERTFIQDQIIRCEGYLNEAIRPDTREKLNIWIDYLKRKQKAISEIQAKPPEWSAAKIALYYVYHDVKITDKNKEEKARALGHEHSSESRKEYDYYKHKGNRVYNNYDPKDRERKAEAVKGHLQDLKIIMEYRGEKDTKAYMWLMEELDELKKNMGQK